MDIFYYIAETDPYAVRGICNKHGFEILNSDTTQDLAMALRQVVAAVGEPAMQDVILVHPDRDVILESAGQKKGGCGCESGKVKKEASVPLPGNYQMKESHLFIFAGALLLAAAIISKNN